jgi:hypothetical protein
MGGGQTYANKALGYSPIAGWPLREASGTNADNAEGTAALDGTYSSDVSGWPVETGIGDGNTAPYFDGINNYVDVHSADLAALFNGLKGSLVIWGKGATGLWTDGNAHKIVRMFADGNNWFDITKSTTNGRLQFIYKAGGTQEVVNDDGHSETDFFCAGLTWDKTGDAVKAYFAGLQVGITQTGLGSWVGPLVASNCIIGAQSDVPAILWKGPLAHCYLFDTVLDDAGMLDLAVV